MMTPTEGGGGVVEVRCGINGSKRQYNCIVDSGASNTLVSARILKPKGPLKHMATGAGMMPVYEQAIRLSIADGVDVDLTAYVEMAELRGIDVLIGQDFLRHFKSVVFDYAHNRFIFTR